MKTKTQEKVYKITYGSTTQPKDGRSKTLHNADSFNVESVTVVADDVYSALFKIEKHMLETEKEWAKNNEQLFVESVEMIAVIDDISQP